MPPDMLSHVQRCPIALCKQGWHNPTRVNTTLPGLTQPYLSPQPLQESVQQHLLVKDFKQGVVQEETFPPSALHKLVNDDGNHQVQHDKVDAKDERDAVDG